MPRHDRPLWIGKITVDDCRSVRHTAHTSTRTRIWPLSGTGSGLSSSASGWPTAWKTIAFHDRRIFQNE
jgi:hypothetical protein